VIGVGWGLPSRASSLKLSIYGFENSADSNALWSECFLATPGSHICWSVRHHGLLIHLFIYLLIIFLLCRIAVHSIRCSLLLPMLCVLCVCVSICCHNGGTDRGAVWLRCDQETMIPPEKDNGQCWENFWLVVTPTPTHNCLMALFPGLPGWACTRRNIHPLTPVLLIRRALSTSSIYYDL